MKKFIGIILIVAVLFVGACSSDPKPKGEKDSANKAATPKTTASTEAKSTEAKSTAPTSAQSTTEEKEDDKTSKDGEVDIAKILEGPWEEPNINAYMKIYQKSEINGVSIEIHTDYYKHNGDVAVYRDAMGMGLIQVEVWRPEEQKMYSYNIMNGATDETGMISELGEKSATWANSLWGGNLTELGITEEAKARYDSMLDRKVVVFEFENESEGSHAEIWYDPDLKLILKIDGKVPTDNGVVETYSEITELELEGDYSDKLVLPDIEFQ